jgi:hypothetical protein
MPNAIRSAHITRGAIFLSRAKIFFDYLLTKRFENERFTNVMSCDGDP